MILLRHGPPAQTGFCYGQSDPALAEPPEHTALRLKEAVSNVNWVYSSPSPRCLDLARALAGSKIVRVEPALMELNFGEWEGQPWDSIERTLIDQWAEQPLDFTPPGGESGRDLFKRVRRWWLKIEPPPDSLIVAHAGSLRALFAILENQSFDQSWQRPVPYVTPLPITNKTVSRHINKP